MAVERQQDGSPQQPQVILNPTAQAVTFFPGLYMFTVRAATPKAISGTADVMFPALLVATAPGQAPGGVEFVGNPAAASIWLYKVGDSTVVKIGAAGATLMLNSIRVAGDTQAFDIQVDRLDAQQVAESPTAANAVGAQALPSLKLQVGLHLLREGHVDFVDSEWAGRAGSGVWIEAFSVVPLEVLKAADIEYKGLAANGFETPWLSDGKSCGTKGVNIPLIGFAIRLKAQAAQNYDCEYSAVFRSGVVIGPLRNGVPCRSKVANDPLDAIQLRIIKREKSAALMTPEQRSAVAAVSQRKADKAPSFGKFREDAVPAAKKASVSSGAASKTGLKPAASKLPSKGADSVADKSPTAKSKDPKPGGRK